MITLKTLKWSNCFSYGADNSVDLSDQKITQILGTNGVGKSSIPLILEEVLFNKNSKGIKKVDIPNRMFNDGYSINLTFYKNTDRYEIDLHRKASIKVKLLKNAEDISSHTATNTYKTIEEILGIDFKTFSQIVYQNTNASLNFLTATDSNRKKFLIDLLGLEKYIDIFDLFKGVSREVDAEYARIEGKVNTIEKWLQNNRLTDTTPKGIEDLPKMSEEEQDEISHLIAEIKNISSSNRKISTNNKYKEMLKNIDVDKARENVVDKEIQSYDSLQSEVGSLNARINIAKDAVNKFLDLGNECPSCGQEVDEGFKASHVTKHKDDIYSWEVQSDEIAKRINAIREDNAVFANSSNTIKEWERLFSQIDRKLSAELLDEYDLQTRLATLQTNAREKQEQINAIVKLNQVSVAHNAKITVISEQTKDFEDQLKSIQESFVKADALRSNLEILKKAFSTNGLIAYKIENLVKELEVVTGDYLAELSDGRFTLNFTVSNDKLNVEITDNGNTVDILALSSGELARVNTATLLGIRKIMNSLSSSQINVLFLDEVITVLDDQGREKLVEVLLEEELNTYLVSHGWSHPLLEKLEVQKHDNISRLING
jgi:DNA repair exonuclease SbcCD ATPase subunit